MEKYQIEITSVFDKEELVAEIWLEGNMVAEINQDRGFLEIQFYFEKTQVVNFKSFLEALQEAKKN
jgi:hypothetical protein